MNYPGGRICRLKLQRFLTYESLEFHPGDTLNLIVGLNGTGKSSLMAGLCLGLGGKPNFTGRICQLKDFIKYNHNDAIIEIELDNPNGDNIVIRRKIYQDNKSTWYLNGKIVPQNDILQAIKPFNIQMDNLCQFLPQEKVVQFSKMDKKARLENMLQTLGDEALAALHRDLIQKQHEALKNIDAIKSLEHERDNHIQKNQRLIPQVESYQERIKKIEYLNLLETQKKVLICCALKEEYEKLKQEWQALMEQLKLVENKDYCEKKLISEFKMAYENEFKKTKENDNKCAVLKEKLNDLISKVKHSNEKINEAEMSYENEKAQNAENKERLANLKQQLQAFESKCVDAQQKQAIYQRKLEENREQVSQIQSEITNKTQTIFNLNLELNDLLIKRNDLNRKITNIKNESSKRIDILKEKDKDAYEAVKWLLQNQDRFKTNIYPPILTQLEIPNQEFCKYIENHISYRDFIAFVCERKDDMNLFVQIMREEKNLRINAVNAPEHLSVQPPYPNNELKNFGLECYIKDLFKAPKPVMDFLCSNYHIHSIPVGMDEAENHIQSISQYFKMFYTRNSKITVKKSRYEPTKSYTKTDSLRESNLLISSKNNADLQNLQKLYELVNSQYLTKNEEVNKLKEEKKSLEQMKEKLIEEQNKLKEEESNIKHWNLKYNHKKEQYKQIRSRIKDDNALKLYITKKIQKQNKINEELFDEISKELKSRFDLEKTSIEFCIALENKSRKYHHHQSVNKETEQELQILNVKKDKLQNMVDKKREEYRKLSDEVKNIPEPIITDIMGTKLEDLNQKIEAIKAQIDLNSDADISVIEEYNKREGKIKEREKQIENLELKQKVLIKSINETKSKWLPPLQNHIKNINQKFSNYYKSLKCSGEILLDTDEDSNEFDKYGLQIRVKYHEDQPINELSSAYHSGGECSVAAILFILSLQELTCVPFRCIDEINQGMDSINERKIFELIVDNACNLKTSQYFLLTPKLLPDLPYHENMKVHIIHNGAFLDTSFDIKQSLNISQSLHEYLDN